MNYKRGLMKLRSQLEVQMPDRLAEFATLVDRLYQNERQERTFGSSENIRSDRSRVIFALNALAQECCRTSFNALCEEETVGHLPQEAGIRDQLQRIEDKLDHDLLQHEQTAAQILVALKNRHIEQTDLTPVVAELRSWAQSVITSSSALSPELRSQVEQLTRRLDASHYLQLALPIIPGLLTYNVELGQEQLELKAIFGRMKAFLAKPFQKGEGEARMRHTLRSFKNKWAILVGINQYIDSSNYGKLQVCVKDADSIKRILISRGFEEQRLHLLTDQSSELPTRDNILVTLKAVANAAEADDLLVFYYSGHGDDDQEQSYLVTMSGRRLALADTALPILRVKQIMEQSLARCKILILDACHSGADVGGKGPKPMSEEFIRRVFEESEGMAILASCKQGELSYEWRAKEQSVFTHFFLEALSGMADTDHKGFVTVQDVYRHVVDGVKLWSSQHNNSQTPTLQASVAGDIILVYYQ
jgi:hypothetical protein